MAYTTIFDNIVFIEGSIDFEKDLGDVSYTYGSFGAQLKNLTDVKKKLVKQAKLRQANCIYNFEYGQKTSWFSLDDTKWWAKGKCCILSKARYDKMKGEKV